MAEAIEMAELERLWGVWVESLRIEARIEALMRDGLAC